MMRGPQGSNVPIMIEENLGAGWGKFFRNLGDFLPRLNSKNIGASENNTPLSGNRTLSHSFSRFLGA